MVFSWLIAACETGAEPLDPTLEFDAARGTRAVVTWTTPEEATGVLDYGPDDGYGTEVVAVESEGGTAHTAVISGLGAGETVHWRVVSPAASGTLRSEDAEFAAPLPPIAVPSFFDGLDAGAAPSAPFTLSSAVLAPRSSFILDRLGRPVWWALPDEGRGSIQARLSADGASVLMLETSDSMQDDLGQLVSVPLAEGDGWTLRTPLAHHDFVELPDGRFAYLALDIRPMGDAEVAGDSIVVMAPDGTAEVVWTSWGSLDEDTIDPGAVFYGGLVDWIHANSLVYDEATDRYWVSCHNLSTVLVIDASTGEIEWQIGGWHTNVEVSGDPIALQHEVFLVPGGFLLFNNRRAGPQDLYSEVIEYSFDEANATAEPVWSWQDPDGLYSAFLGGAERLADGGTLVSWGAAGRLGEVGADGTVKLQLDAGLGVALGYAHAITQLEAGEDR